MKSVFLNRSRTLGFIKKRITLTFDIQTVNLSADISFAINRKTRDPELIRLNISY